MVWEDRISKCTRVRAQMQLESHMDLPRITSLSSIVNCNDFDLMHQEWEMHIKEGRYLNRVRMGTKMPLKNRDQELLTKNSRLNNANPPNYWQLYTIYLTLSYPNGRAQPITSLIERGHKLWEMEPIDLYQYESFFIEIWIPSIYLTISHSIN